MNNYKVAGYIRLSKEDKIKDESNSVTNQKLIITSYIKENKDLEFYDFYIDDGYSGTTFDKPGYKRMFNDIIEGKINTVVVKDLSRFGRNHIESDNYLENILPGYNVRFISVIDDIDSLKNAKSTNTILIPLKNLINDQYARDISEKVRSTLKTKQLNGQFIGVNAPYGYLKNPKDKHKFIIDRESSYVVKKIFNMTLLGKSRKEIAEHLNDRDTLTPSLYKQSKEKISNKKLMCSRKWNAEIVSRILKNETYTGTLIQNVKTKLNYKTDKLVDVNRDDWIVIPNHHEPIITKEVFDKVQNVLDKKKGYFSSGDIFAGYLKCSDCGKSMALRKSKDKEYYYCSSFVRNHSCTNHSIRKDRLEELIFQDMKEKYPNTQFRKISNNVLNDFIDTIVVYDKNSIKITYKKNI